MVICIKCGTEKSIKDMVYNATLGSYANSCKACKKLYDAAYRKANHKKLIQQDRDRYAADPSLKRRLALRWYRNNKARRRETDKIWSENNKHLTRHSSKMSEARARGLPGHFTFEQWEEVLEQFDWKCAACRKDGPLAIDHIVPRGLKGKTLGTNTIDNVQPLCQSCNSKKKRQIIDYRNVKNSATGELLQTVQTDGQGSTVEASNSAASPSSS